VFPLTFVTNKIVPASNLESRTETSPELLFPLAMTLYHNGGRATDSGVGIGYTRINNSYNYPFTKYTGSMGLADAGMCMNGVVRSRGIITE
jgi:hypothetical protein